ncbi:MAG: hypothetical protein GY851_11175, partial [bacterium]|nr:hypothetical protein [bacterium]
DDRKEVFVTANYLLVGGKAGKLWRMYVSDGNLYHWTDEYATFRDDAAYLGPMEGIDGLAIVSYWPGSGTEGSLIAHHLVEGTLTETKLRDIRPRDKDEDLYKRLFERGPDGAENPNKPAIERTPFAELENLCAKDEVPYRRDELSEGRNLHGVICPASHESPTRIVRFDAGDAATPDQVAPATVSEFSDVRAPKLRWFGDVGALVLYGEAEPGNANNPEWYFKLISRYGPGRILHAAQGPEWANPRLFYKKGLYCFGFVDEGADGTRSLRFLDLGENVVERVRWSDWGYTMEHEPLSFEGDACFIANDILPEPVPFENAPPSEFRGFGDRVSLEHQSSRCRVFHVVEGEGAEERHSLTAQDRWSNKWRKCPVVSEWRELKMFDPWAALALSSGQWQLINVSKGTTALVPPEPSDHDVRVLNVESATVFLRDGDTLYGIPITPDQSVNWDAREALVKHDEVKDLQLVFLEPAKRGE